MHCSVPIWVPFTSVRLAMLAQRLGNGGYGVTGLSVPAATIMSWSIHAL